VLRASLVQADEDLVVVDCRDPELVPALGDLFFQEDGGNYVRRFPPGSVSAAIFARLEASLEPMLRQTARLDVAPFEDALRATVERLAGVDWWLTGSGALALRGIAVSPRDIDLVVADEDAARVAAAFDDALIEPAVAVQGWFCRWWGRAWLGARVEWVGGVTDAADQPEPTDFGPTAAAALEEVVWHGSAVRVPPLDLQRAVSVRRGLDDRVRLIDALAG
jgi:hypothetical protein